MKARTVRDLAAIARVRRKELGWTQADFAAKIGVGREWVIKFEQGKPTVELGIAVRALRELGLLIELRPGSANPSPKSDDLDAILGATTRKKENP